MNNFNKVFLSVKKHCGADGINADENCFKMIAEHADIPLDKLNFYLNSLQDLDLIKYSWNDKSIHMTPFGKMHEKLFMN